MSIFYSNELYRIIDISVVEPVPEPKADFLRRLRLHLLGKHEKKLCSCITHITHEFSSIYKDKYDPKQKITNLLFRAKNYNCSVWSRSRTFCLELAQGSWASGAGDTHKSGGSATLVDIQVRTILSS